MKRLLLLLILSISFLFGDSNATLEQNASLNSKKLQSLRTELLNFKIKENEWTKTYAAYITHKELIDKQQKIQSQIEHLKSLRSLTKVQKKRLQKLQNQSRVLQDKINLVKDFEKDPFKRLVTPPSLKDAPKISNPLAIIAGISYLKELSGKKNKYLERYKELDETIKALQKEKAILEKIAKLSSSPLDKRHLEAVNAQIKEFLVLKDIFKTTKDIYLKKSDELKIAIEGDIKKELKKVVYIAVTAFVLLLIFLILKFLTRKYFANKESFYTINKVINIGFITLLALTLLFAYIENVNYIITILGFASAGIAIAMKDWFMSLMGWFVIVLGGAIHVGDRIKVVKDGVEYVGDVVDISILRITIYEDVTLTTYMQNRRAGRMIFVPNNYIFTDLIANYSHGGLKTVWDGIDFVITFDSNASKAANIAKNIAKKYSKGYTDMTRRQLSHLRSKYQLKNTNVEPKVFTFIEQYGIKVSVWYLTNSYATLTLRGTISNKIIQEILESEDIKLAYPTQSLYLNKNSSIS